MAFSLIVYMSLYVYPESAYSAPKWPPIPLEWPTFAQ
jgi:hypothetical protein